MLGRQRQLLEAFAEAFVGLRKGYEQFGAEVGVRTVSGSTALHRARTSGELLDYLLQPNLDPAVASRELIAIFADLGIHHLAMMEAITEAVRAVLQALDPRASDMDVGSGLLSRGKIKAQWKTYVDRFDQLITDDDELHTAIFGDEFARAYASVTLGDAAGPRLKKEDKE
jgi:predicted component of type VI protein secretion system